MKLIFCPECQDIRKLGFEMTCCRCGKSYGKYFEDGLTAVIGGKSIPLGIDNVSLGRALRPNRCYGKTKYFTAFIIPEDVETISRIP